MDKKSTLLVDIDEVLLSTINCKPTFCLSFCVAATDASPHSQMNCEERDDRHNTANTCDLK